MALELSCNGWPSPEACGERCLSFGALLYELAIPPLGQLRRTSWYLANSQFGGEKLPLQVCKSAAGYYLGTLDGFGYPYSRESAEYWPTEAQAAKALNGELDWTQRDNP